MNAVAYYRFSSDNQHEESIEAQQEAVQNYALNKDILILKEYIDRAESATSDDRPQFQLMTNDITNNKLKVDYVLVHHSSRFARNRYDAVVYKHTLNKFNVRVISVTQPTGDGPESVIMEALYEAMDEHYSKRLSIEVKTKMRKYAEKAEHLGGIPPLGYDIINIDDRKKYQINLREAEAIKSIYSMYIQGISKQKIANHLNSLGYRTKLNHNFTITSLYEILKNEKYTGVYIYNRAIHKINGKRNHRINNNPEDMIRIENGIPQIIDKETFEKVQALLEKRKLAPGANKAVQTYLLTGLIYCGKCGGHMVGHRKVAGREKNVYYSYECSNRTRMKNCDAKAINKEYIEKRVLEDLYKQIFNDPTKLFSTIKGVYRSNYLESESGIIQANQQMEAINNKLNGYLKAIEDGLYTSSIKQAIKDLELQKEAVAATLEEFGRFTEFNLTDKMIQNYIDTHKEIIFKGTLEEQKVILPLFLEKIVVYDKISDLKFIVDLNGGGGAYTFKSTIDISDIRGSIVHVNTGSVLGIMSIKNLKTK